MPDQVTQCLPVPTQSKIVECQKLLGTGIDYDLSHLFTCYETSLWVLEENQELTSEKFMDLTLAKFILLRQEVLNQIREFGRFTITTPFQNPCSKCGGSGEIFKFMRKSQLVDCMKCVEGKIPDGSKCKTCKGKSKIKTFGIIPRMKDTTTCTYCKGKGFFKPRQLDNPLIDNNVASEFKKKLVVIEKQNETNVGAAIHSSEPDQVAPNPMFDPNQDNELGEGTSMKKQQPPAE